MRITPVILTRSAEFAYLGIFTWSIESGYFEIRNLGTKGILELQVFYR